MRRLLILSIAVALAGMIAGVTLWPGGGQKVDATSQPRNSPDPIDVPDGSLALKEAEFSLGMGCEQLSYEKVNEAVKKVLASRGISRVYGPPAVHLCEKDGDEWTLLAHVRLAPRNPDTLKLPAVCSEDQDSSEDGPCPPDFSRASGTAVSSGTQTFTIRVPEEEVVQ